MLDCYGASAVVYSEYLQGTLLTCEHGRRVAKATCTISAACAQKCTGTAATGAEVH